MGKRLRGVLWGDFEPACLVRMSSQLWFACLVAMTAATKVRADDLAQAGKAASTGELMGIVAGFLVAVTGLINSWHRRKGRTLQRQDSVVAVDAEARGQVKQLQEQVTALSESLGDARVDQARAMVAMENRLGQRIDHVSADVAAVRTDVKTTLEKHHEQMIAIVTQALLPKKPEPPAPPSNPPPEDDPGVVLKS